MTNQRVCANTPALPRRTFIGAAASLPIAMPARAQTNAETSAESELSIYARGYEDGQGEMVKAIEKHIENCAPDPILALYEKYEASHESLAAMDTTRFQGELTDAEWNDQFEFIIGRINGLIFQIAAAKAETFEGLGAQYQCLFREFSDENKSNMCAEFGVIFDSVKDGFERLT